MNTIWFLVTKYLNLIKIYSEWKVIWIGRPWNMFICYRIILRVYLVKSGGRVHLKVTGRVINWPLWGHVCAGALISLMASVNLIETVPQRPCIMDLVQFGLVQLDIVNICGVGAMISNVPQRMTTTLSVTVTWHWVQLWTAPPVTWLPDARENFQSPIHCIYYWPGLAWPDWLTDVFVYMLL